MNPGAGTQRIGFIALDERLLRTAIGELLALDYARVSDGIGSWNICPLWSRGESAPEEGFLGDGSALRALGRRVGRGISLKSLSMARVFAASRGGYVRPHRDWTNGEARFVRLHIPLSTSDNAFSSEDRILFRMRVGEIWSVDGERVHSGGSFGPETRLHLILDFPPHAWPTELVGSEFRLARAELPAPLARPSLSANDEAAILGLAKLIGERNFDHAVALLGTIHFQRDVDCAALYDWLDRIAAATGNERLVARSAALRRCSIGDADDSYG